MYRKLLVGTVALACYLTGGVVFAQAPPQMAPGIPLLASKTVVNGGFTITIAQYYATPQAGGPGGYLYYMVNGAPANAFPWKVTIKVGNATPVKLGTGGAMWTLGGPLATFPPGAITSIYLEGKNGAKGYAAFQIRNWP
jgi:hypothetical protein